tara:strand:+ start:541 stop:2025 length:1485 start_codon:yes stop_codon:yes gene_type:complete
MKKIVKNFNNLVNKTIFKVQNKTNNNFKISNFNKYLISIFGLLFFYLFYLLIPLLYDKNWVQINLEDKLLTEFKINLSVSADISYRILPKPHFLIKDSKILIKDTEKLKSIAEIKNLKVFLSQGNFLEKEKMYLTKVIIDNANFSLLRSDLKILNNSSNNQFSNKKIKINNSKIFFKDNLSQIIAIAKIDKANLFFDDEKLLNFFSLRGEIFAIPFTFDFENQNNIKKNKKINLKAKSLKLNIFNEFTKEKNKPFEGKNIISILNSTIITKYNIKDELIFFNSKNIKISNTKPSYTGQLTFNPFDLDVNIKLDNYEIFKLFDTNSILNEFFKSELLINDNISIKTSIDVNSKLSNKIYQKAKINFHIVNGKMDFNNTKFINNEIGSLKLNNSNLFVENNKLLLSTDIFIEIENHNRLFSFLNTSKKARKKVKNIMVNLEYDFLSRQIKFNNIVVDNNKVSDQFFTVIEGFNDNSSNNLTKSRRLLNDLLSIYEG